MRIDYSEPKQSYVIGPGKSKPRPRKEPVGLITSLVVVTGIIAFLGGFGTGWFFSQKAAKKSFQAATAQNSLENSPKQPSAPAPPPQPKPQPAQQPEAGQPQPAPGGSVPQTDPGSQTLPEPPLSFYKTLPSGEKNNIMGSGINARNEKGKQPLQAAIPSNVIKQPQPAGNDAKPAADKTQPSDKSPFKTHDAGGFTVQVASYSLKSEAESLKSKLANKGYNVAIIESNQGDKGTWYRVRVGRKLEQDAAKELAGKLGKGAMVIPDRE
jgi:cell division protein FtsN